MLSEVRFGDPFACFEQELLICPEGARQAVQYRALLLWDEAQEKTVKLY